ncbi:hypothetical protein ACA910_022427 [Epithemia clementina (nom. ined.)]
MTTEAATGRTTSSSSCGGSWTFGYIQGLIFIFLVALIWAASSILVQALYTNFSFDSPFLLTYIGSSLFTLWLPTHSVSTWIMAPRQQQVLREWIQAITCCCPRRRGQASSLSSQRGVMATTAMVHSSRSPLASQSTTAYHNISSSSSGAVDREDDNDDGHEEGQGASETSPSQEDLNGLESSPTAATGTTERSPPSSLRWTHNQHFQAALFIAPVWFIANWTYNASLHYTSITSSTVLASTGSLFTFLFAILTRDESFGWIKLMGVILGVMGSCLTALSDASNKNTSSSSSTGSNSDDDHGYDDDPDSFRYHILIRLLRGGTLIADGESPQQEQELQEDRALWGDILGLISAVGYGGYAIQTRLLCPRDESLYSMQLILGYIGLLSLITLTPITFYILWESPKAVFQTWWVLGALIVKGLLDNVLSDFLWLRAVILTNATVATVGLGMTIPLAFLSDIVWLHKSNVLNALSTLGAVSVLTGFVLVNVGNQDNNNNITTNAIVSDENGDGRYDDNEGREDWHPSEAVERPLAAASLTNDGSDGSFNDYNEEEDTVQLQQIAEPASIIYHFLMRDKT